MSVLSKLQALPVTPPTRPVSIEGLGDFVVSLLTGEKAAQHRKWMRTKKHEFGSPADEMATVALSLLTADTLQPVFTLDEVPAMMEYYHVLLIAVVALRRLEAEYYKAGRDDEDDEKKVG